jgi:hypothetical protein
MQPLLKELLALLIALSLLLSGRIGHRAAKRYWDRLTTQLIELTIYALTLLGPSEGAPTSLRSVRSTPTAHRGNALCACRLGKVDNSSKVA